MDHDIAGSAGDRRYGLDRLTPGLNFKVAGIVEFVEFRHSANGHPYLLLSLAAPDGTKVKAMAFDTAFGQHRTACAAVKPGCRVRLVIKAAEPGMGFVNDVEIAHCAHMGEVA